MLSPVRCFGRGVASAHTPGVRKVLIYPRPNGKIIGNDDHGLRLGPIATGGNGRAVANGVRT